MGKVLTLGEILLRYSTERGEKIQDTRKFSSYYGGSEPNVAIGLSGLGHKTQLLSAVPNNQLGQGAMANLRHYGVDTSLVKMTGERMGVYYVESGAGNRATSVLYDRKYSSISELKENPWQDELLFQGVDIFHVSGITTALSKDLLETTIELMELAKKNHVKVSFDSNYRAKLWCLEDASQAYKRILPLVDFLSASKLDAINILGVEEKEFGTQEQELAYYYQEMEALYPNIEKIYSTVRDIVSTDENYLMGSLWENHKLFCSKRYHVTQIVERIGGGDSFSAGMLHSFLTKKTAKEASEFATGMSVLKHTYLGDAVEFSQNEIEAFIASKSSKINR